MEHSLRVGAPRSPLGRECVAVSDEEFVSSVALHNAAWFGNRPIRIKIHSSSISMDHINLKTVMCPAAKDHDLSDKCV
jgi:hypothetical protein